MYTVLKNVSSDFLASKGNDLRSTAREQKPLCDFLVVILNY